MTRRWVYVWKSAAAVFAILLAGEFSIRALELSHRRDIRLLGDLGHVSPAGTIVRWGSEGRGVTHYVGDGEIATPYSSGPAVIVLGDSVTEGFQVDDPLKFVSVAEELLHTRGIAADLRNFGRSGASMADYVWLTKVLRKRFQPAVIVIQIGNNDVNFRAFDPTEDNHFVVRHPGLIELVHQADPPPKAAPFAIRKLDQLSRYSVLLDYARYRYEISRHPAGDSAMVQPIEEVQSVHLQAELLRAAAGDTPVIMLWVPYSPYLSADEDPAFNALREVLPWTLLDSSEELRKSRERGHDPRTFYNTPMGGGHLNTRGNAIIGRILADELERLLR